MTLDNPTDAYNYQSCIRLARAVGGQWGGQWGASKCIEWPWPPLAPPDGATVTHIPSDMHNLEHTESLKEIFIVNKSHHKNKNTLLFCHWYSSSVACSPS